MNEQQMYAPPQYTPKSQQEIDADNLSTLAVCHYVAGAMIALFSCMFLIYVLVGAVVVRMPVTALNQAQYGGSQPYGSTGTTGANGTYGNSGPPMPFNPGYIFVIFGCVGVFVGWTGAALTIIAGRSISARKHYVFILVVAGLGCAFMNLVTTTLGVFTFIVLMRPTVKVLFEGQRV